LDGRLRHGRQRSPVLNISFRESTSYNEFCSIVKQNSNTAVGDSGLDPEPILFQAADR
jgi:hypothetical protein